MPPTSIRMAIAACLQNLSKEDLEKFCHALIHRGGDPRVRRNKVEEKTLLQITDTLVNTFTEPGALEVTLELLRNVDCSDDANELVKDTKSLTISTPTSSSAAEASGGAANLPALPTKKHFIDKHRLTLISRVTNLDPILDELLEQVIDDGVYNKIKAEQTTQKMMRAIMDGPMKEPHSPPSVSPLAVMLSLGLALAAIFVVLLIVLSRRGAKVQITTTPSTVELTPLFQEHFQTSLKH